MNSDVFKVTAIIAAYNEEDIIAQTVGDLIKQGIFVYFLDNHSTDDTLIRIIPFLATGMLQIEKFPGDARPENTTSYHWEAILRRKEELARDIASDWFIHADADEFRESPWAHLDLLKGIQAVDRMGYNAIDFEVFEFQPTHNHFMSDQNIREAFEYYAHVESFNKNQIRCWKKQATPVELAISGGHEVEFQNRRVFPVRFILRHYPVRSQTHGERKVFKDRVPRFLKSELEKYWHVQYNQISKDHCFIQDAAHLPRYDAEKVRIDLFLNHRELESLKQTVALQQCEVENLKKIVELHRGAVENLKQTIELQQNTNKELTLQLKHKSRDLQTANFRVSQIEGHLNLMYRSLSWRITAPLRRIGFQFPRLLKWVTHLCGGPTIFPIAMKDDVVHRKTLEKIDEAQSASGSIGIQLHLFYIDLLDEIAGYLSNIPYPFNLYVSITDGLQSAIVKNKLKSLNHAMTCSVKTVPNRGRDVAPFVVHFADELLKNDFICHIHSKKSLYAGIEQSSWRKHFYDNLLGSQSVVRKIFGVFHAYKDVGIIYPETYEALPYWAHSWLQNKLMGQQLLTKFQIGCDLSGYIDLPMGTMFWARTNALRPILSSGFTIEDFPEESSQNDGTLAHAMERILVPIALRQGYTFCEINMKRKDFSVSFGSRNLFQYWAKNLDDLKNIIRQHDLITFDIFDTLFTRPLLNPDSVFDLLSIEVERKEGIKDFRKTRQTAEAEIRNEKGFGSDAGIDEIYKLIRSRLKLDNATIDRLCSMEKDIELQLNIPRSEVTEAFRYAQKNGKRIVLMSDMYLDEATVNALLKKNGIEGHEELFLSSSMGVRKDSAGMWLELVEQYPGISILHIGDNEHSDVQIPCDMGIDTYHVMAPNNIFSNSLIGRDFPIHAVSQNVANSALFGMSVNHLFNNPFCMHDCKGDYTFSDKFGFGYAVIGPVIFAYLLWLLKSSIKDNVSKILFLAREGFLLKKIFDTILTDKEISNRINSKIETVYLHASRRALTVPAIYNLEDSLDLLKRHYRGQLFNLMETRLGLGQSYLEGKRVINSYVEIPTDLEKAATVVREHFNIILANALKERVCYLKYLEQLELKGVTEGIAVSDLGYSGNIQKALSKLLGTSLRGYYFATCSDIRDNDKLQNKFYGYYTEDDNQLSTESASYKYSLVLEGILTSPDGQLAFFEENGDNVLPVFGKPSEHFNDLSKIHQGITAYCCDMLKYFGRYLLDIEPDRKIAEYFLGKVISENKVDQEILSQLKVEDKYCSDGDILSI